MTCYEQHIKFYDNKSKITDTMIATLLTTITTNKMFLITICVMHKIKIYGHMINMVEG